MDKKLAHIRANGKLAHRNQTPTVITEQEVNAYLASGAVQLPAGVQSVKLTGAPGVINGTAYGEHGIGYMHVDSVSLDGVEVPHFGLEPARDW